MIDFGSLWSSSWLIMTIYSKGSPGDEQGDSQVNAVKFSISLKNVEMMSVSI